MAVPLSVLAADPSPVIAAADTTAFTVEELASHGDRPALLTSDTVISYADLAHLVEERAREIGSTRRLVLLASGRNVSSVVTYLAALTAGHPVLLAPEDDPVAFATLADRYAPDVVAEAGNDWRPRQIREGTAHDLHPDLALLLSTSGSTGSAKLVRLSHGNVRANASSIAEYLGIRGTDRAIASLPLHYCYGLSVLHSHLLRGAGLVLTDRSVVDPCFWELFRRHRATTFAGVPHTFSLLDRVGFDKLELPSLRYVTQAGGRLAPDQVVRFAELGRRSGWDLYVMYGQTEATARMAYLPPDLATAAPGAIGRPVPGGSLRLEPVASFDEPGVGELVYAGPNVMLGYAESAADLAKGRVLHELRTGDLGRQSDDGMFEVVGRLNRFVKVYGLRVDLEEVEATLAGLGVTAACAGSDDHRVVVAEGSPRPRLREVAAAAAGLPKHRVRELSVQQLPRLASGKLDARAVADLAEDANETTPLDRRGQVVSRAAVRTLYAELLDRPHVSDNDSFVSLDGDSLSYVEVSLRLEELLGQLPEDWHLLTVRELVGRSAPVRRRWRRIETGVALRAGAIIAVVGSHVELLTVLGGAHILLALAGHGFGRFHLSGTSRTQQSRHLLASVARIAVPSAVWIAAAALVFGELSWRNVILLNSLLGPDTWDQTWQYWFVETLVHVVLVLTALLSIPVLHRAEQRAPFAFPMVLVGVGLLTRYDVVVLGGSADRIHTPHVVFWLFALGWATAKARSAGQRWLVSAVVLATVPGFFQDDPVRDVIVMCGLLVLVWVDRLPCPDVLARAAGVLASASLYIYLTHWQIYPYLEDDYPAAALLASVALGIAYWAAWRSVMSRLRSRPEARAPSTSVPRSSHVATPVPPFADRRVQSDARPGSQRVLSGQR